MQFKRRNKADAKSTDGDVETGSDQSDSAPRTRPASSPTSPASASRSGGNPLAAFLRKALLVTARDMQDSPQTNYLLIIIKDVISGTLLGVFFLMILIFLDYRNVVQLGSARAFRRAAFELMTDPETVKSIEENIEVKFIPVDVFNSMKDEIARNEEKMKDANGLKQHEEDLLKKKGELDEMRKEYDAWTAKGNAALGLDRWCGACKGGWGNCDGRVKYLMDTYHTPEIKAKVDIMKDGKCTK